MRTNWDTFTAVLRKDLKRRWRSPLAAIILLIFPLVFSLLIGLAFGRSGEKIAPIRLALVDEDRTLVSRMVGAAFREERGGPAFDIVEATYDEALRMVERDRVSALVRVPSGLMDSILAGRPAVLEVVRNPSEVVYPEIVETYVEVLAQFGGSASRLLAEPLERIRGAFEGERAPEEAFVAGISTEIYQTMRHAGRYLLPPLIRLENAGVETEPGPGETAPPAAAPTPSAIGISVLVLPGMAVYALLMLALVSMVDFHREAVTGTMARQFIAPIRFPAVVAGKIAAVWVVSLIAIAILAAMAAFWAPRGIHFGGFVLLSMAVALFATGFAALVQSISRSERTGSVVGSILVLLMSMLGGSFIPMEGMPPGLRAMAPFSLVFWGTSGYRELLAGGVSILANVLVLAAFGLACCAIAGLLYTRRYRTGG